MGDVVHVKRDRRIERNCRQWIIWGPVLASGIITEDGSLDSTLELFVESLKSLANLWLI